MSDAGVSTRTVSADPGLLSHEELLARTGRRRTLEELIAKEKMDRINNTHGRALALVRKAKKKVRWFIDNAQIKISVSDQISLPSKEADARLTRISFGLALKSTMTS